MVARLCCCRPWGLGLLLAVALAGCRSARSPVVEPLAYTPSPSSGIQLHPRPLEERPASISSSAHPVETPPELAPREKFVLHLNQEKAEDKQPRTPLGDRLQLPLELPGRDAPIITLPAKDPERKAAIERHFAMLDPLPEVPRPTSGPVHLAELENLALAQSPVVRQAAANVDAARGVAIQAGLYPNPTIGYAGDSINMGGTAGTQGGVIQQTIKTGGKLRLARAAAEVEVENAELALRRAQNDIRTQVRRGFYSLLVTERNLSVVRAFAKLSNEVYTIQVTRLRLGQAAVYEPLQARVLAIQSRAALIRQITQRESAWRQLAAVMGVPDLPLPALAGDLDRSIPRFAHSDVLPRVLSTHTDTLIAANSIGRQQLNLRLSEVTPVPDLSVRYQPQYDYTTIPHKYTHGVGVSVEVPLWNRNQGGIREADARLAGAVEEQLRVRNDLTAQLAAAFQKYENNRALVLMYRDQMVPDQARAYRSIYKRYDTEPEALNFNDVITAQQTLAETIKGYVEAIGGLWDSVVDIANLLQLDDLDDQSVMKSLSPDQCLVPSLELLPQPHGLPRSQSNLAGQDCPEGETVKPGERRGSIAERLHRVPAHAPPIERPYSRPEPKKVRFKLQQISEAAPVPFEPGPQEKATRPVNYNVPEVW